MAEQLPRAAERGEQVAVLRAAFRGVNLTTQESLVLCEIATSLDPSSVQVLAGMIARARHAGHGGEDLAPTRTRVELVPLPLTGGKHRKEGL